MKNQLTILLGVFVLGCGFSQTNNFWEKNLKSTEGKNVSINKNDVESLNQKTYNLNVEKFKEVLSHCPNRYESFGQSNVIISLPTEDGKFKEYRVKETNTLHPDLAKKFPNIKSYVGASVKGENEVVHFSLSNNDFSAMIMKSDATITNIKHPTINSKMYTVTSKMDGSTAINCQTTDNEVGSFLEKSTSQAEESNKVRKDANDGRLRVYRMAIAVTGELSKIYTDKANVTNGTTQQKKAAVLAELNELMTRVNAIYERDLGTTFELVPNIFNSIFLDPRTDGITHGNTSTSIGEAQGVIDAAIGNANYDIGHILDSEGTGRGDLDALCNDAKKAQGATGAHPFNSVNNYFFFTFVHEIAHQFGANHSFNNSCGGNRLDEGAVEPGGGHTIMAYTGCAPNKDNTQYPFFHAKQIDEMWNRIVSRGCGTTRSIGNSAPIASIGGNYTIPRSTPFILEGSATDANASDQLTYTWDQMDKEIAPMPPKATSTNGPLFIYKPPTTSPKRYMPDLSTVKLGKSSSEWEVVPSVARTMNFRFTVRDNHPGGGNTDSKDAVITVSGTAGPFVITSPNTSVTWAKGSRQTVTWNVAGTTGNGVNAANVDILLSTDGGNTYPITLASRVPNNGSHQITVPNNEGGVNRIMVRGTNHIFFDISDRNFIISDGSSDPMPTNYCAAGNQLNGNYIKQVTFGSINNSSGNSSYTDFTTLGTNLVKGTSVPLTIIPFTETWNSNVVGAWIDWNKDGDFTDAGEEVLMKTPGTGGQTTNVLVPNTAKNGATRLRVRYKWETKPDPCGTAASNGNEVEDYMVFIISNNTPPTCNDGIQNGDETGVDCGGSCSPCTTNPTCNDGIQNGDETGVDCGGSCAPCQTNVTYCNAGRQGTNYIASVTFGSISNTSANGSYSNFTAQSTSVTKGTSVTLTVNPAYTNWGSNVIGGWIDWNQNGDFSDPGEQVLMKTPGTGGGTTTVVIPSTAKSGNTRLRVRYKWASNPNPCGNTTADGDEVEDYTINISGGTSDTQAPTNPTNLRASNIAQTTLTLNWTASTDNIGVTGYDIFRNNGVTPIGTTTGTSFNVTGLTANTTYTFFVRAKDAANNNSGNSNTINATTTGTTTPTPDYCTPSAGNPNGQHITNVVIGSINNNSGPGTNGYTDYTSQSTSISGSTTLSITPQATWSDTRAKAWIDWNKDGDFDDNGEEVLNRSGSGGTYTSTINPPSGVSGSVILRVRVAYSSSPTPCGDIYFSDTEDYTLNLNNSKSTDKLSTTNTNSIISFPNPFKDTTTIDVSSLGNNGFTLSIYNVLGEELIHEEYKQNPNRVTIGKHIKSSGYYFVRIQSKQTSQTIKIIKLK